MDFPEWEPIYIDILKEFGYSREEDEAAARLLYSIAGSRSYAPDILKSGIKGKDAIICGDSDSLGKELKILEKSKKLDESRAVIITADEATSVVMDFMLPDIIVTDLDGNVKDQISANGAGSIAVIHAHGDNIPAIEKYVPLFKGRVVLTTQSKPFEKVYNFGGFTDGDRAFLMARHFGARKITLAGFDFENPREKEGKDIETKRRKLRWAKKLIEMG
ncbi:MAG: hypothetical protein DRN33_00230 [Thermoplasmata archaeon]|nr:MAG: hypothetical protein DRN33_00230 [Thermoplasmata archaeon]